MTIKNIENIMNDISNNIINPDDNYGHETQAHKINASINNAYLKSDLDEKLEFEDFKAFKILLINDLLNKAN